MLNSIKYFLVNSIISYCDYIPENIYISQCHLKFPIWQSGPFDLLFERPSSEETRVFGVVNTVWDCVTFGWDSAKCERHTPGITQVRNGIGPNLKCPALWDTKRWSRRSRTARSVQQLHEERWVKRWPGLWLSCPPAVHSPLWFLLGTFVHPVFNSLYLLCSSLGDYGITWIKKIKEGRSSDRLTPGPI